MLDSLEVRLASRSYPLQYGADLGEPIRERIAECRQQGRRVAVITDRNVAECQRQWLDSLFAGLPIHVAEPGETEKSLAGLGRILDFLAESRLDRDGLLFVMGGGVVGDLGGFAAAVYLRGIEYIQIPTTLLAMVDSSIGGKTGVNLAAGKNLAGAFYQPRAVLVSTAVLATLPAREFAAGVAEVIKYGLLGNAELFAMLERETLSPTGSHLQEVIRTCGAIKARLVAADEREQLAAGGRALLNLGHTFGHAIEQVAGYGAYLHGEAVAVGLHAAARLSRKLGLLTDAAVTRVERVIAAHQLPVRLRHALDLAALGKAMLRDKKVRLGKPRLVVLEEIGRAAVRSDVSPSLVEETWREVGAG